MRTQVYKIFLIGLVLAMITSCDDFLTEHPNGQLSSESVFTEHNDLVSSVNSLYKLVRDVTNSSITFAPTNAGDDLSTHPASNKISWREYDKFNVSESNGSMTYSVGSWGTTWKLVKCANYIINGVDQTPDATEDELIFAKGHAYYWRAYAYFFLVRNWGPIPMILDQTIENDVELSSVQDIYDLIVSDLQKAEELPENYSESPWANNGRNVVVSRAAAEATLGYVYMTMAGWPLNMGTEYYGKAAVELKKVIDGVENDTYYYDLYDDFKDIHSKRYNYDNKEAILSVYYSRLFGGGDAGQAARGGINDLPAECGAWNDTRAEIGFWLKFPDGDRKDATFGKVLYWDDNDEVVNWWDSRLTNRQPYFIKSAYTTADNNDEYDITKSYDSQATGWQDQAHIVVRLGEVYCWYAEAVGNSGQTSAKAFDVLNKVITRAKNTEDLLLTSGESADVLAKRAYDEHGWEIAGWYWASIGARKYDQQRMNRLKDHFEERVANEPMEVSPGVFLTEPILIEGTWNDMLNYSPYPASDIMMNVNFDNTGRVR